MADFGSLNLSKTILSKLTEKNITKLSEKDFLALKSINEGSNVTADNSVTQAPIIIALISKVEFKKLKVDRTPRVIVLCENSEKGQSFIDEVNTLITKEIISVLCNNEGSKKKLKKKCSSACDIIVGEINKVSELMTSDVIKVNNVSTFVIMSADKIINEESKANLNLIVKKLSENLIQSVVLFDESSKNVDDFVSKNVKDVLIIGSEKEENSEDESSGEKKVVAKVNGDKESESSSEDDESSVEEKVEKEKKMEVVEDSPVAVDQELINKIKSVTEFESLKDTAEKLIKEDGDVASLAKALSLIAPKTSKRPVHTGDGSKLTGRDGYTAYLFMSNQELWSSGYMFKSLKRNIPEDVVNKIEKIQQTKDKMGFVFDLASENDDDFQNNWSDGKYDRMSLLEVEIPELLPEVQQAGDRGRGGFERGGRGGYERGGRGGYERGGRGGYERGGRGGYERGGRGGYERGGRGGFERGGRGGDRGKRSFTGGSESAAKVQKFE